MVIFIHGDDSLRSRQYLHSQIAKFKAARDPQGYNVVLVDGREAGCEKINAELSAAPFLAERRMIVVANLLASSDKELLSTLCDRLRSGAIPSSNVVVFYQAAPLAKTSEAKALRELLLKEKYVQEFPLLTGANLAAWVQQVIKERGGQAESAAITELCRLAGQDMWLLSNLIDQAIAYGQGRTIVAADVAVLGNEPPTDAIFALIEAIMSGVHGTALRLLASARDAGQEDGYIAAMLAREVRILLELKDFMAHDPSATSATAAGILKLHPFVAKKSWAVARRLAWEKLRALHDRLVAIDLQSKTGYASLSVLVELFVEQV